VEGESSLRLLDASMELGVWFMQKCWAGLCSCGCFACMDECLLYQYILVISLISLISYTNIQLIDILVFRR
jgi:hypothetical protein